MGDYCKEKDSDCRETDWPLGLYRRGNSFRFRRRAGRRRVFDVWGAMPLPEAIRKATRYNLDLEEGRNPVEARAKRETTVAEFARGVWFPKKGVLSATVRGGIFPWQSVRMSSAAVSMSNLQTAGGPAAVA